MKKNSLIILMETYCKMDFKIFTNVIYNAILI